MKPQIDYARIFRAAARMDDTSKARQLLNVVAAAAGKPKDMAELTDKTHAEHFKKRKDDIDHLHRELKSELRMVESEVSRKLRRHFAHADIKSASGFEFLFDPETLAADLADILAGTLPDMLVDAGQDVYEGFLPPPEEAQAFITERENLMKNVAQETFDSVKAELQEGLDKGESYRELSKRLSSKFDEINEGRAQTVASTEVASAYGYARHEAMKQSGAKFKLWVGSGRPPGTLHGMRPAHAAAHYEGQTVAIDEPFRVGGQKLMFPTDSSLAGPELTINCHCVALPAEGPIKSGEGPGHPFRGNQYTDGKREIRTSDKTHPEFVRQATEYVDKYVERFPQVKNELKVIGFVDKSGASATVSQRLPSEGGGVELHFSNAGAQFHPNEFSVSQREHRTLTNDLEGTVRHEVGHLVHNVAVSNLDDVGREHLYQIAKRAPVISDYSSKNVREAVAENFDAYLAGKGSKETNQWIKEFLAAGKIEHR